MFSSNFWLYLCQHNVITQDHAKWSCRINADPVATDQDAARTKHLDQDEYNVIGR